MHIAIRIHMGARNPHSNKRCQNAVRQSHRVILLRMMPDRSQPVIKNLPRSALPGGGAFVLNAGGRRFSL
jgi:hypothetical protein